MKPTHLLFAAVLAMSAALAPQSSWARKIEVHSFNGPSRRAAMFPPAAAGYPDMRVGKLVWASVNVDDYRTFAVKPDTTTKFYQFNRTKAWAATGDVVGWGDNIDEDSDWLPDSSPCPTEWRLPTLEEYRALHDAGNTWAAADDKRGNDIAGRFYGKNHDTCKLPSSMSGCIFFPSSGIRNHVGGELNLQGILGYGWSSMSMNNPAGAYNLYLDGANSYPYINYETYKTAGMPVRCVRDVP